jgi:hypothetical protein
MPARSPSRTTGYRRHTRPWKASCRWPGLLACILAVAGCETEVQQLGKRPETRAPELTGVVVNQDDFGRPATPAPTQAKAKSKAPAKPEFIVGKRTQDIRNAGAELQRGQAQVGSTRIVAKDPFTLQGNAYVSIVGQASIQNIKHAVDLYQAENGRYPKDFDEFMDVIIKANNIALPMLPHYQEYGYDDKEHKLIILEYPAHKAQPQ